MKTILSTIEKNEEGRIKSIKNALSLYSEKFTKLINQTNVAFENICKSFDAINPLNDIQEFINKNSILPNVEESLQIIYKSYNEVLKPSQMGKSSHRFSVIDESQKILQKQSLNRIEEFKALRERMYNIKANLTSFQMSNEIISKNNDIFSYINEENFCYLFYIIGWILSKFKKHPNHLENLISFLDKYKVAAQLNEEKVNLWIEFSSDFTHENNTTFVSIFDYFLSKLERLEESIIQIKYSEIAKIIISFFWNLVFWNIKDKSEYLEILLNQTILEYFQPLEMNSYLSIENLYISKTFIQYSIKTLKSKLISQFRFIIFPFSSQNFNI